MVSDEKIISTLHDRVTAGTLRKLYDALEDETTPYDIKVRRMPGGEQLVVIKSKDIEHFAEILKNCEV